MEDHPITEADIGVVAIRDTLKKLDGQVDSIEKQIQRYVLPRLLSSFPVTCPLLSSPSRCEPASATGQYADIIDEGDSADGDGEMKDPGGFEKGILSQEPSCLVDSESRG